MKLRRIQIFFSFSSKPELGFQTGSGKKKIQLRNPKQRPHQHHPERWPHMSKTASQKNGNLNDSIHTTIARLRVPPEVSPETSLIVIAQLLCAAVHECSLFSLLTFFFFLRKDGIQRKRLTRKDNKTKRERELYGLSYTAIVLDSPLVGKTITNYNRNAAYRCEPHILSTFFDMTPFCI